MLLSKMRKVCRSAKKSSEAHRLRNTALDNPVKNDKAYSYNKCKSLENLKSRPSVLPVLLQFFRIFQEPVSNCLSRTTEIV